MRKTSLLLLFLAGGALGQAGCGASYSTLQPGRVTPKGDFRVQAGMGAGFSPGAVKDLYDNGKDAAGSLGSYVDGDDRVACEAGDRDRCFTAQALQPLAEAVVLQAAAPAAMWDALLGLRYGVLPRTDLGLRFGSAGWLADARYQVLGDPQSGRDAWGWDGSVGLGFSRRKISYPSFIGDVSEALGLDDSYRWDVRLPATVSYRLGPWGYLYGGMSYMLSRWHIDTDPEFAYIDNLPDGTAADTAQEVEARFRSATAGALAGTDTQGYIHQVGAVGGFLFGYKYVYVGLELNLIRYWLDLEVLHKSERHSGTVVYPAGTLMVEF